MGVKRSGPLLIFSQTFRHREVITPARFTHIRFPRCLSTVLAEHQLEVPFPQRDVHVRSVFGLKDELARRWLDQSRPRTSPRDPA